MKGGIEVGSGLLNHFSLYNLICRDVFNGLVREAWDWFKYRVSVMSTGLQGLIERGGERVQVVSHQF